MLRPSIDARAALIEESGVRAALQLEEINPIHVTLFMLVTARTSRHTIADVVEAALID
jgi:hypothetical protein